MRTRRARWPRPRRILEPGGRLLIVDFAPHDLDELRTDHAHRRLGIAAEHMTQWLHRAGLGLIQHDVLPPPWRKQRPRPHRFAVARHSTSTPALASSKALDRAT